MSDEQETGGVRRFGRRDRKRSLDPRGPLFPPEEQTEETPQPPAQIEPPAVEETKSPEPLAKPVASPRPAPKKVVKQPTVRPTPVRPVPAAPSSGGGGRSVVANLLTVLFIFATIGLIGVIALIVQNPYTPLNPFPPFTSIPIVITATFLPPTDVPADIAEPTATFTPLATEAASAQSATFALVGGQATYKANANDKGCNWSSIAGTVTDASGAGVDGYRVHVKGNDVDETVFSGATASFGGGGFELFLNGTPQAQTYTVQLSDPQSHPLSPEYTVDTQTACDQNVALLQFVQQP